MRIRLSFLLLALVLTGCGAAASGSGGGNPDRIGTDLLREADPEGLSAYQMIQRHRPQWLRASRGGASFGGAAGGVQGAALPRVVLNGVLYGEVDSLRGIEATSLDVMEYVSASDATTRFGTGYPAGAILLRTR